MDNKQAEYLDNEEKELIESYGDFEDLNNFKKLSVKEQAQLKKSAKKFVKKETKMNIRIDSYELNKIKERAEMEGLKYQTFIKSIIHKYITDQLVEKQNNSR